MHYHFFFYSTVVSEFICRIVPIWSKSTSISFSMLLTLVFLSRVLSHTSSQNDRSFHIHDGLPHILDTVLIHAAAHISYIYLQVGSYFSLYFCNSSSCFFFFFFFPQSKFLTFCSLELLLLNPCVLSALPRSDFFLLRMLYRCLMLSLVSSPFLRTVFLSSECHSIRLNASLSLIISFSHWPNSQSLDF